jgi:hypothetical protein
MTDDEPTIREAFEDAAQLQARLLAEPYMQQARYSVLGEQRMSAPVGEALEEIRVGLADIASRTAEVPGDRQAYEIAQNLLVTLDHLTDQGEAERERLQADAAYGRTAMDNYATVQQERDDIEDRRQQTVSAWNAAQARIMVLEAALAKATGETVEDGPNACLIAAAPDLLDALRATWAFFADEPGDLSYGEVYNMTTNAIAKATPSPASASPS